MECLSDFDTNKITLMLMTNSTHIVIDPKKEQAKLDKQSKEIKFYRKRVFVEMKDMLRGKFKSDRLQALHNEYVTSIINILKEEDITEILQKEHENYEFKDINMKKYIDKFNVDEANKDMMKSIGDKESTLDSYVSVKRLYIDKQAFPQVKKVNIKTKAHRYKKI